MKILLVAESLGRGGSEKQLAILAERLPEFCHSTSVVVLYYDGWWGDYLRKQGISISGMDFRSPPFFGRKSIMPFLRFVRLLRKERPDAIIANLYRPSVLTALAAIFARNPIVISRRGDCGYLRGYAKFPRFLERLAAKCTNRVVAVSKSVARITANEEKISYDKIKVIHNGVCLPQPPFDHDRKESKSICALGNLSLNKGQITLVRAMKKIIEQHPSVICKIVGEDSGQGGAIAAEIRKLDLQNHVQLSGMVTDPEGMLRDMSIGVLCSISEGFPNAILEYMAHSKPVVATASGGAEEIVVHGKTGLIVPKQDPNSLAEAILYLLGRPKEAAAMGKEGRKRVENLLTEEKCLSSWDRLLRELAGEAR